MTATIMCGVKGIANITNTYEMIRRKRAQLKRARLRKVIKEQESWKSSKKFGKRDLAYVSSVEKLLKDSMSSALLMFCLKVLFLH